MNIFRLLIIALIFGVSMTFGPVIGERFSIPGTDYLVPAVEARVGRPLTPVSVAGVSRRTTRRTVARVSN